MTQKIVRFAIIIFFALLQVSFSSFAFFDFGYKPELLLFLVVSWTIFLGFDLIKWWVIATGLAADFFFFDSPGKNVIVFVSVAYFVNFLYRRFLFENRGVGILTLVSCGVLSLIISRVYAVIFSAGLDFSMAAVYFFKNLASYLILNSVFFLAVYQILRKIEKHLSFFENKIKLKYEKH